MVVESHSETRKPSCSPAHMARALRGFILHWSPIGRNSNRRADKELCGAWRTPTSNADIALVVAGAFPDCQAEEMPAVQEESLRHWIRLHCHGSSDQASAKSSSQMQPEETLPNVPPGCRNLLAALNLTALETELRQLSALDFLYKADKNKLKRLETAISAKARMWRRGFKGTVSIWYRLLVNAFFILLIFLLLVGTVSAFIRDERAYNARMIGPRVVALVQLYYIREYEFHTLWLLYNWSLERVLGAAIGNLCYFFAAISPTIGAASQQQLFRATVLAFSIIWQIVVQFWDSALNECERWAARHRIRQRQKYQSRSNDRDIESSFADSGTVYKRVMQTIRTSQSYKEDLVSDGYDPTNYHVSLRIRVERLLLFADTYAQGRAADQDFQLFTSMLEEFVNVFLDYESCLRPKKADYVDNGYMAPRGPKVVLVGAALVIFVVTCYSFKDQELTFNTVVPYSVVVLIKQSLGAWKRYYSVKAANRTFSNMVAFNIWAFFLVSLPILVNQQVFESNLCMAILTLAMTFATCFLSEPIAPIIQHLMEMAFPQ